MSACCVSGCKNRHSSASKLKLYRIPSGSSPFQANRRRLWLQAIQKVNGSTEELKGNARICGAHFKSQEASMDHDSPDFVPSVFTCTNQSAKKKVKWFYGKRKRRRRSASVKTEEKTSPPRAESPVDLQSSVLIEEVQTPSVPKEGETLTEEAETETETTTIKSQTTSSPNKVSPSFKAPADFPEPDKRNPIVLLKRIYVPGDGYQCEHCSQSFTDGSQLIKHKRLHEEESCFICESCGKIFTSQTDFTEHQFVHQPSFPCNICDRSFTTNHNLKRHKLLHVKDGRKCPTCGVLFCKRHNHILFLPLAESVTEYEEDDSTTVGPRLDGNVMPENPPEPSQTADLDDDTRSSVAVSPPPPKPKSKTGKAPTSRTSISSEIPAPVYLDLPPLSHLPPPVTRISNNIQPLPPQDLELPPSLKLFSPQYLTSAFLEVQRNYEYILSKPRNVEKRIVKEEPSELPLIPPDERSVEHIKKEAPAYDLEVVL